MKVKAEDLNQKCPECGCINKNVSKKMTKEDVQEHESDFVRHVPSGSQGVIRCTDCGYIFEYCQEHPMPLEVKKKLI
jgi:Cys-rich peptide (TIGR04165 family)